MGSTGNEHAPRGRFDSNIIRAAIAFDVEFLNLKSLRVPDAGRGKYRCEKNSKYRQ
jgi:hypothetical protein